jgi:hypothetical protein
MVQEKLKTKQDTYTLIDKHFNKPEEISISLGYY